MNYNKVFLLLLFTSLIFCGKKNSEINEKEKYIIEKNVSNQKNDSITIGMWHWRSADKTQEFTLKIKKITKDSVFAQYCAVYNNGSKMDCNFEDINNVRGVIKNNKALLEFSSFFGAKNGKAELSFEKNNLRWIVTQAPEGEYYAPHNIILRKNDIINSAVPVEIEEKETYYQFSDSILPYKKKIDYKNIGYKILPVTSINGISEFACGESEVRYISVDKSENVSLFLVPMDCGDTAYRYYLISIFKGSVVSSLYAEGELFEPESNQDAEKTTFSIDKRSNLIVRTLNKSFDKNKIEEKRYKVTNVGKIIELK